MARCGGGDTLGFVVLVCTVGSIPSHSRSFNVSSVLEAEVGEKNLRKENVGPGTAGGKGKRHAEKKIVRGRSNSRLEVLL